MLNSNFFNDCFKKKIKNTIMNKSYVLLFLFAFNLAYAQWDTNSAINNPLCIQPFSQIDSKIISDLNGGSIIVWVDYRNDATLTKADIYAQRLDANGNIKWHCCL
jgi:hypothetical protein